MPDRILVVEDDESMRDALAMLLRDQGYEVDTATNGREAIEHVDQAIPALIISDIRMPGGGGLDMVKRLRERAGSADLPIILVSGLTARERRVAALDLGADDYLHKPFDADELLARVRVHLRHARRHQELARRAVVDPLTGLMNRAGIMAVMRRARERALRGEAQLSILAIDLDRFKALNDRHGHQAGDQALKQISRALLDSVRIADHVGRIGGDEFVIVVPDSGIGAEALAGRLRAMAMPTLSLTGDDGGISLSIGAATLEPGETLDSLLARADAQMYIAKRERHRDRAS